MVSKVGTSMKTTRGSAAGTKQPAAPATAKARKVAKPKPPATAPAVAPSAKGDREPKLVRDSYTIPETEFAALQKLKRRAVNLKRPAKKSELLRAGIAALGSMDDKTFLAALAGIPSLKTGRPKKASGK